MKKTYKQLSSELILVETEETCISQGSVRIESTVTVQAYEKFTGWDTTMGGNSITDGSLDINFE